VVIGVGGITPLTNFSYYFCWFRVWEPIIFPNNFILNFRSKLGYYIFRIYTFKRAIFNRYRATTKEPFLAVKKKDIKNYIAKRAHVWDTKRKEIIKRAQN